MYQDRAVLDRDRFERELLAETIANRGQKMAVKDLYPCKVK